jgi:hypothetical protein
MELYQEHILNANPTLELTQQDRIRNLLPEVSFNLGSVYQVHTDKATLQVHLMICHHAIFTHLGKQLKHIGQSWET